jgi:preprotein translocase subunit SecG
MYLLLIGLIVLAAILMCLVVLAQNSKGGGLSSSFASSNQIMGVRKTTDFIEKLTWGLAAFMVVCSVLTAYFVPSVQTEKSVIMDEALKERATNPLNNATAFPAASTDGQADGQAAAPADSQADNAQPATEGQNAE